MVTSPNPILASGDVEYLSFSQAALLCSVSEQRFGAWVDKGLLPVIEQGSQQLIRAQDLIEHLIRHNIRLPERLLQGNRKKILFILLNQEVSPILTRQIIWLLYRVRRHKACIVDFIRYGEHSDLKLITFEPNLVIVLGEQEEHGELEEHIRGVINGEAQLRFLGADGLEDLEALLAD